MKFKSAWCDITVILVHKVMRLTAGAGILQRHVDAADARLTSHLALVVVRSIVTAAHRTIQLQDTTANDVTTQQRRHNATTTLHIMYMYICVQKTLTPPVNKKQSEFDSERV